MVDARIHNRCESQAYRMQLITEEAKRYCGAWINRQPSLFPWLEEELDPLTAKLERLVIILDTLGLEAFVAPPPGGRGGGARGRPAVARALVAKTCSTFHGGADRAAACRSFVAAHRRLGTLCSGPERGDLLPGLRRV